MTKLPQAHEYYDLLNFTYALHRPSYTGTVLIIAYYLSVRGTFKTRTFVIATIGSYYIHMRESNT